MQKIKILFYIKDPNGGTGRFLEQIYQSLQDRNQYEVKIVTHIKPHNYNFISTSIGTSFEKQSKFSFKNIALSIVNLIFFTKYVFNFAPDIIYSLDIYANITSNIVSLFFPKVFIINSSHVNISRHITNKRGKLFALFLAYFVRTVYKIGDIHIVPSKGLKKQLAREFGIALKKIKHIPYFVDVDKIKKLALVTLPRENQTKKLSMTSVVKIISIVRMDKQKDVRALIQACEYLNEIYKKSRVELFILGIDTLNKTWGSGEGNSFMSTSVTCLGWKKNPYKYLRHADIFLLLTNYEGFSYAILEAQLLGIPVMASDVDYGPRELITHKINGILLKNNEYKSVAEELFWLIKSSLFNQMQKVSINQKKIYDKAVVLPQYKELFQTVNKSSKHKQ